MTPPPNRAAGRLSISASLKPRELMTDTPRLKDAWSVRVLTLFPEAFPGSLGLSLTGKALEQGIWALETIDLRSFGTGKHRRPALGRAVVLCGVRYSARMQRRLRSYTLVCTGLAPQERGAAVSASRPIRAGV